MIQRDIKLQTNIHRNGGFGNEFVENLNFENNTNFIQRLEKACKIFSDLVTELEEKNETKFKIFKSFIQKNIAS